MTDLRTPNQIAREKRADRVCQMYESLSKEAIGSRTSICNHIADTITKEGTYITPMGVTLILKKRKLW